MCKPNKSKTMVSNISNKWNKLLKTYSYFNYIRQEGTDYSQMTVSNCKADIGFTHKLRSSLYLASIDIRTGNRERDIEKDIIHSKIAGAFHLLKIVNINIRIRHWTVGREESYDSLPSHSKPYRKKNTNKLISFPFIKDSSDHIVVEYRDVLPNDSHKIHW